MDVREDLMRFYRNPPKVYPEWNQYYAPGMKKTDGSTFKYNTFPNPAELKSNHKNENGNNKTGGDDNKIKLEATENLKNLLKEFETRLNFYENHRVDWVEKVKKLGELAQDATGSKEDTIGTLTKDIESLKFSEKELIEGVDQLEAKHQSLEKVLQELSVCTKANGPSISPSDLEKQKAQYDKMISKFNKFNEDFTLEKKALSSLNERIEGIKSK